MSRPWIAAALHLTIGLIATVALAWAAAIWSPITHTAFRHDIAASLPVWDVHHVNASYVGQIGPADWPLPVPADWPRAVSSVRYSGPGLSVTSASTRFMGTISISGPVHPEVADLLTWSKPDYNAEMRAYGWPWRAFVVRYHERRQPGVQLVCAGDPVLWLPSATDSPAAIGQFTPRARSRFLPLIPSARGLTADTTCFALALWLARRAPGAVRRHSRLRRGLCPACAYNLSGLAPTSPCPECGAEPTHNA